MRMGGLFHKRQNSLFCVSHLILSNTPKAIRPHAHCLKDAQFMRPPLPRRHRRLLFKPRAEPRCCSAPARSLKKKKQTKRRQMRFKSEGYARPGERPGERACACVCLFVPRRNQRAKLQKAFWFVVFTSRTADTDAEQTRAGFFLPSGP